MSTKSALIVFAREPKDGKIKTRLAKDLPISAVTCLYKAFVKDVLNVALKSCCDQRFIYYVGNGSSMPFLRKFEHHFQLKRQTGKDLGERMYRAFCHCRKENFDRIIIVGSDCLTLTERDINRAFQKLENYDCVLGPSKDGGYYLIALKSPHWKLFEGINWSTELVLRQTLQRARQLYKKTFLLKSREDIDTAVHLERFSKCMNGPSVAVHTRKILQNLSF